MSSLTEKLTKYFPVVIPESHGQEVAYVKREDWHAIVQYLRDECGFAMCLDVAGVDHLIDVERLSPSGVALERFEVVANFLAFEEHQRIRLICEIPADDPQIPSIADVYPGANFGERETWDLFGIRFEGHPDLTRILMPEDWEGFPLRKDDAPARVPVAFKEDPGPK